MSLCLVSVGSCEEIITVVGQAAACQSSSLVERGLPHAVRFQIHPTNIFHSSIEKTTGTFPGGKKVRMNVGSAALCYICTRL